MCLDRPRFRCESDAKPRTRLIATPASVSNIVALDTSGRNKLNLLQTILPLVLGIAGGVALIAGIILSRRPRPTMEDELDAMSRQVTTSSERPASAEQAAAPPQHAELAGVVPGFDGPAQEERVSEATAQQEAEGPEASGGPPAR